VPASLQICLAATLLGAIAVFVAAFRFAMREFPGARRDAALPRARVLNAPWARPRAQGTLRYLQAGFVALGITSVFVMVVCALGIVALMIAS
jgi:hypothetical protein